MPTRLSLLILWLQCHRCTVTQITGKSDLALTWKSEHICSGFKYPPNRCSCIFPLHAAEIRPPCKPSQYRLKAKQIDPDGHRSMCQLSLYPVEKLVNTNLLRLCPKAPSNYRCRGQVHFVTARRSMDTKSLGIDSKLVHAGHKADETGAVNTPIYQTSTLAFRNIIPSKGLS